MVDAIPPSIVKPPADALISTALRPVPRVFVKTIVSDVPTFVVKDIAEATFSSDASVICPPAIATS